MCQRIFEHFLIALAGFSTNSAYSTIAPVFPLEVERRHLSSIYSGFIFCSMSVGFFSALFLSKSLIKSCGRLASVFWMFILLSISLSLFGLAKQCQSDVLFVSLSILARLGQGLANSFISSTLITMVSVYYDDFSSYITVMMLGVQLADLLGPLWGGFLFNTLGYTGIFLVQGLASLAAGLLLCYFRGHERAHPLQHIQEEDQVSFCHIFKVPGVLFGIVALIASESFFMSVDPILPYKLSSQFGYDEHGIGVFFFQFTGVVILATFLILFIPEKVNKLLLIVAGGFALTVGAFLTGPSKLFKLPNKLGLIRAGMTVSGVGKALIQSYVVTYVVMSGQEKFVEEKEEVERKVPLLITGSFATGTFLIPLVMSAIYKALYFRTTLDILGLVFFVYAVAFTIHAVKNNWGKKQERLHGGEQDQQELLQKNDI